MHFTTTLAPRNSRITGGFGAGPINPRQIADKVFGESLPGPWLTVYMLRRFGWPNAGSDDDKALCEWTLTTPIPGLFLSVSPYMGGSNLHFGVRHSTAVGKMLIMDPVRERFFARKAAAVRRWWRRVGCKLYVFGKGSKEGDEDTLVHLYAEDSKTPGVIWGLWERKPAHKKLPRGFPKGVQMLDWWLSRLIEAKHPEVRLPRPRKNERRRQKTLFQIKAISALRTTMMDLLSPTNIRDLPLNPFGRTDVEGRAAESAKGLQSVPRFAGAGYAPEYYFSTEGRRQRLKDAKRAAA